MRRSIPLSLFVFAGLFTLIASCSKDLKYTNKVHGTWKISSIEHVSTNGSAALTIQPDGVIQFDKCQVNEDETRGFRQHYAYLIGDSLVSLNATGSYIFDEEATKLIVTVPSEGSTRMTVYNVLAIDRRKLVLEEQHDENTRTVLTLAKK